MKNIFTYLLLGTWSSGLIFILNELLKYFSIADSTHSPSEYVGIIVVLLFSNIGVGWITRKAVKFFFDNKY